MSVTVCVTGSIRHRINAGGSAWLYVNWALGLQALGCRVIWLEVVESNLSEQALRDHLATLRSHLEGLGLTSLIALCSWSGQALPWDASGWYLSLKEASAEADLFLNLGYLPHPDVKLFRRSVFVDGDPGLTQYWMSRGELEIPPHDLYLTIGETVGTAHARFPSCGKQWLFTPLPIHLPAWPVVKSEADAPFTTVSNWWDKNYIEVQGEWFSNEKRTAFLDYLDLPRRTSVPLELALTLTSSEPDEADRKTFQDHGWRIRSLYQARWMPNDYRLYVQGSRGEFSCAKPFYIRLESAMIHDRTLHYLASGKPACVQYTGSSGFLPDAEGLFRFRTLEEAALALQSVGRNYEYHARQARALAEEYFDARKVVTRMLELASN
jgi:hypothetical protein